MSIFKQTAFQSVTWVEQRGRECQAFQRTARTSNGQFSKQPTAKSMKKKNKKKLILLVISLGVNGISNTA